MKNFLCKITGAAKANPVETCFIFAGALLSAVFVAVMISDSISMLFQGGFGVGGKKQVLDFLGLGIGGVIALYGLVALNRRANAQVKQNELQGKQNQFQAEQNALTENGLFQERFKTAVEHLSSESKENAAARISSFYEFYYLANDRKDYAQSILDILCAHLRTATNQYAASSDEEATHPEEVKILTELLFGKDAENVFGNLSYDLQTVNLSGFDFAPMFLPQGENINLTSANLRRAILASENLGKALLKKANLSMANLSGADLRGAKMREANLQGASLLRANLQKTILWEANLQEANLSRADLRRAFLFKAKLQKARLRKTNLQGVKLRGADLQEANLQEADLREANLCYANLSTARNLEDARLIGAIYNEKTGFPPGFEPSAAGMVEYKEEGESGE